MQNKHSSYDIEQMSSLPLEAKIRMTEERIRQWFEHWEGKVYVPFSGGKDSTALLHIVRSLYPSVEAVFSDTGLEFPEIREFVRSVQNVRWLKPEKNFKRVILEEGYPVATKEVALKICNARKGSQYALNWLNRTAVAPNGEPSTYICSKRWQPLYEAPFKVNSTCCDIMKKKPIHKYEKETGNKPFIGTLATESINRRKQWERAGCNSFDSQRPRSTPMAFWTENDVLTYLHTHNIPYASVYGDIVETGKTIQTACGEVPELKTTGAYRTGCMFCMFGCHLEKQGEGRFLKLKETHPIQYNYCMKPVDQGGLGLKDVIDWVNEHCGTKIEYWGD